MISSLCGKGDTIILGAIKTYVKRKTYTLIHLLTQYAIIALPTHYKVGKFSYTS